MEWNIDYHQEYSTVLVKVLSPADFEGIKQLCIEMDLLAREHNTHRYLIDHRGVDVTISVFELDQVPEMLKEIKADFEGKVALLMDTSAPKKNLFNFLKNVLNLESMRLELFSNKDQAIAWLTSE
jgi:hypothetical protein